MKRKILTIALTLALALGAAHAVTAEEQGTPLQGHDGLYIKPDEDYMTVGIYDSDGKAVSKYWRYIEQPDENGAIKVGYPWGMADSRAGLLNSDLKSITEDKGYYSAESVRIGDAVYASFCPNQTGFCDFYDMDGNAIYDINAYIDQNRNDKYDGDCSLWAAQEVKEAEQCGLAPGIDGDYQKPITRLEFCRLAVAAYNKKNGAATPDADSPFSDVDDIDVTRAYYAGIVSGTGGGKFSPDALITRQEAAVMLDNLAKAVGLEQNGERPESFIDEDHFADWAYDSIYSICRYIPENGRAVMTGKGEGKFSPWNYYTREQAMATVLRLCKCGFVTDYRQMLYADLLEIGQSYQIGGYKDSLFTLENLAPYFEKWDANAKTGEQQFYTEQIKDAVGKCVSYYVQIMDYMYEHGVDKEVIEPVWQELYGRFFEQSRGEDPVDVMYSLYMTGLDTTYGEAYYDIAAEASDYVNNSGTLYSW